MADGWAEFRPPCEAPRPPVPVGLSGFLAWPCGRPDDDNQTYQNEARARRSPLGLDMGRAAVAASPNLARRGAAISSLDFKGSVSMNRQPAVRLGQAFGADLGVVGDGGVRFGKVAPGAGGQMAVAEPRQGPDQRGVG